MDCARSSEGFSVQRQPLQRLSWFLASPEFIISSRRTLLGDETFEFRLLNHLNSDLRAFGGRVDEYVSCRKRKYKDWAVEMLVKRLSAIVGKNIGGSLEWDGTQDARWELGRKLGGKF